jgi:bacillithiol biosynthesis cysteine-adding enzyme BshC
MACTVSRRVPTASASNGEAAAAGLWEALDTVHCGHPDVVSAFLASVAPGSRFIDIGCWNGSIAELAAQCTAGEWASYLGVDTVPAAARAFNARHASRPGATAVVADARALPVPDDGADVLLCLFVLQDMEGYREDGLRVLRELARVARPGARLLLGLTVHSLHEESTHYVVKKLRREGLPEKPTHHWHGPELLAALRACGLRITDEVGFGPNDRGFVELYVSAVAGGQVDADERSLPVALAPGSTPLLVDYLDHFPRVAPLFRHDFRDPQSFVRAGDAAAGRELPREEVASVVRDQQTVFAAGEAAQHNVERLRHPDAVAVLTGQQPALFGGPLHNLYKAATAVRLARHLESSTGRPHVPVFWIANDDHVLTAVDHVHAVGDEGLVRITWDHRRPHTTEPLSEVRLDERVADAARELLRHAGSAAGLAAALFRPGERLTDCFGRLLSAWFEQDGLVVVDPSDPRLRRLGMPRLAPELAYPAPSAVGARIATAWLAGRGYPAQVALREDRLGLFHGRTQRFRLRASEATCQIQPGGAGVTWDTARTMLAAAPQDFSPNVLLRPLYQDALFPTAAYVAGPGEIAYFAQLGPVYDRFGLPMPVVYPRKSMTLVSARARRDLASHGLTVSDVLRDVRALGPDAFRSTHRRWLHDYLVPQGRPQERVLGASCVAGEEALAEMSLEVLDHELVATGDDA